VIDERKEKGGNLVANIELMFLGPTIYIWE